MSSWCLAKDQARKIADRRAQTVNLQMEAMGAKNRSGQVNTVGDEWAMGGNVRSDQFNSVVDVRRGTSSGKRDRSIVVEKTISPGTGDVLLEVESVISMEKSGISRPGVVRSPLRIFIRSKDKVTVSVIGEIHLVWMKEAKSQTQIMLTVILAVYYSQCIFGGAIGWAKGWE